MGILAAMSSTDAPTPARRPRVLVLFGGRSGEHAISCVSAGGVLRAIDRERYDVLPVGITPAGRWVRVPDDPDRWAIVDGRLPEIEPAPEQVLLPLEVGVDEVQVLEAGLPAVDLGTVDVVLPLLHGPYGEDGTVQGMLELADVRYVGAGVLASALGMDKHFMKIAFQAAGLQVAPWVTLRQGEQPDDPGVRDRVEALGLPLYVKPARAGSSLGITRVTDLADLPAAVDEARRHDPKVLVESGVVGREIECAVLGGRGGARARASAPGEIVVDHERYDFYDFQAKYLDGDAADLRCPADLDPAVTARVQEVAVRAFEAVDGEGLARVDVFVTEEGPVVVNEINTMPGFTPISMYPRMWQQSGLDYAALLDELLQLALERPTGLR